MWTFPVLSPPSFAKHALPRTFWKALKERLVSSGTGLSPGDTASALGDSPIHCPCPPLSLAGSTWCLWQVERALHFFSVKDLTGSCRVLSDWSHKIKTLNSWEESYDQPRQHIKKQRHYFANKSPSSQDYGFSSGHVWMWELDYKESWAPKNWCFWTVVLEKTLESPLDCKEIQPVHPKGNQSWIFIVRTDAEAEAPICWLPDVKSWLIGKDRDAGKYWGQEEKGTTEDEIVGWHHRLSGHEFE